MESPSIFVQKNAYFLNSLQNETKQKNLTVVLFLHVLRFMDTD